MKDTGELGGEKPWGGSPASGVPGFCLLELGCHVRSPPWTPSEPHAVGAFWSFVTEAQVMVDSITSSSLLPEAGVGLKVQASNHGF